MALSLCTLYSSLLPVSHTITQNQWEWNLTCYLFCTFLSVKRRACLCSLSVLWNFAVARWLQRTNSNIISRSSKCISAMLRLRLIKNTRLRVRASIVISVRTRFEVGQNPRIPGMMNGQLLNQNAKIIESKHWIEDDLAVIHKFCSVVLDKMDPQPDRGDGCL